MLFQELGIQTLLFSALLNLPFRRRGMESLSCTALLLGKVLSETSLLRGPVLSLETSLLLGMVMLRFALVQRPQLGHVPIAGDASIDRVLVPGVVLRDLVGRPRPELLFQLVLARLGDGSPMGRMRRIQVVEVVRELAHTHMEIGNPPEILMAHGAWDGFLEVEAFPPRVELGVFCEKAVPDQLRIGALQVFQFAAGQLSMGQRVGVFVPPTLLLGRKGGLPKVAP